MKIWGSGLLKGMAITMRNMLRTPITVQYPHQKVVLPERARWALQMKYDEAGEHKCTACLICERTCPDYIIDIEVTTAEDRSKHIDAYTYEIGACMMCGLCVEACPFDAIQMGKDYELARTSSEQLTIRLLEDTPAVSPKRKAAAASENSARTSAAESAATSAAESAPEEVGS